MIGPPRFPHEPGSGSSPGHGLVVFLPSNRFGSGPEELGEILIRSFLKTLLSAQARPDRLVLVNSGVLLAVEGSDLIPDLRALEESGIEIISCGTCLDFFHSKDKLRAGRVSNMAEIVETLTAAVRVVRL